MRWFKGCLIAVIAVVVLISAFGAFFANRETSRPQPGCVRNASCSNSSAGQSSTGKENASTSSGGASNLAANGATGAATANATGNAAGTNAGSNAGAASTGSTVTAGLADSAPRSTSGPSLKKHALQPVSTVSFASTSTGFVGGKGVIYKTSDSGKTWKTIDIGDHQVIRLQAVDATHIIALTSSGLLYSADGKTFTSNPLPTSKSNAEFNGMSFATRTKGFAAFDGQLWYTADSGAHWLKRPLGGGSSTAPVDSVAVLPGHPGTVFAGAGRSVYKSTDWGKSWTKLYTAPVQKDITWHALVSAYGDTVWAELPGDEAGLSHVAISVFSSTDGGQTWIPQLNDNYMCCENIDFRHQLFMHPGSLLVTKDAVYLTGMNVALKHPAEVLKTIDDGQTWQTTQILSGTWPAMHPAQNDIAAIDGQLWLAFTVNGHGQIWHNGGKGWVEVK